MSVLVTRDEDTDGPLSQALRERGAQPICLSLLRHLPPEDDVPLRNALDQLALYDWLVLTSVRGVEAVGQVLAATGQSLATCPGRIACVGGATARAAEKLGASVAIAPEDGTATALAAALTAEGISGKHILYPKADLARPTLVVALQAAGAKVHDPIAYRTVRVNAAGALERAFKTKKPDAALFCSPSAVEAFVESLGAEEAAGLLEGVIVGSIGPSTSEALVRAGLPITVEARERTFEGLAKAL